MTDLNISRDWFLCIPSLNKKYFSCIWFGLMHDFEILCTLIVQLHVHRLCVWWYYCNRNSLCTKMNCNYLWFKDFLFYVDCPLSSHILLVFCETNALSFYLGDYSVSDTVSIFNRIHLMSAGNAFNCFLPWSTLIIISVLQWRPVPSVGIRISTTVMILCLL